MPRKTGVQPPQSLAATDCPVGDTVHRAINHDEVEAITRRGAHVPAAQAEPVEEARNVEPLGQEVVQPLGETSRAKLDRITKDLGN